MKTSTVQEKFNEAPLKIQDIVMSVETSETLYGIEKKYEVYKEENGLRILPKETTRVLIGITHPRDFVPVLMEKLDVPKEKAQEIAKEVNQKIFSQVKDLLIEIHGLKKTQTTTSETPPTSSGNIPTPPVVPQKSPTSPQKKEFAEIKIPKKSENFPIPPKADEKKPPFTKSLPADGRGFSKTTPAVPIPQVPQKKEIVSKTATMPPIPKPPQDLNQLADSAKKESPSPPTQEAGLKNPFEEKLRQTFTIPEKIPLKKEDSEEAGLTSTETPGVTKPASTKSLPADRQGSSEAKPAFTTPEPLAKAGVAGSSNETKKEEIKKNPYLETIE